jgi:single-stranded-DNA-specific exonuclease
MPDQIGVVIEQENAALPANSHMVDLVFTKLERLNYHMYSKIRELGPFGAANPEPVFKIEGLRILSRWSSGFDGRNLRLLLGTGPGAGNIQFKATLMRGGAQLTSFDRNQIVNVIFCLEPAWSPAGGGEANKQEVWLKILQMEIVKRA